MPVHDDLGLRMKQYYENIPKTKLMRRTPVAIRVDGKAFHTFTRGFQKPFDEILIKSMQETMKYMCENIQGCVLGYTQSDEITLILTDYKKFDSAAWFDYEVQKVCSIVASMATLAFNKAFDQHIFNIMDSICHRGDEESYEFIRKMYGFSKEYLDSEEFENVLNQWQRAATKGAMFDARCFNIPKEEVTNLIYWRQLDATRNSIQMVGQANFSHKELQEKNCNMIQDMLMTQKDINWNDFPAYQKRGSCCIKERYFIPSEDGKDCVDLEGTGEYTSGTWRSRWIIDKEIPQFKGEGRNYIERLIDFTGE